VKSNHALDSFALSLGLVALASVGLLYFLLGHGARPDDDADLVVNTTGGRVRGIIRRGSGAEFLGIPFAQPPIGDLRWREPQPVKPWEGVRDSSSFGAPCAQTILGDWNRRDAETSNEDCLFLNVITPEWRAKKPLPVMFWIHGGANAGGTASSALYKDGTLPQHGIILVTANYRLGVFGFMAHPELTRESSHHAAGNYGLMDQIAALRWVRDNIASFGGDPNNITVFGQSAGAQDTSLLMTSPLAKGLFHRAIAQSGSGINPPLPSLPEAERRGERLAAALKAPAGDGAIKYLRQLTTEDLFKGVPAQNPTEPPVIGPDIDGWVIPRSPADVFAVGHEAPIPLIIGVTSREFSMSGGIDATRNMIKSVTESLAPRALSLYGLADGGVGKNDPLYGPPENQWFADFVFRCPVTTQAAWHTSAGHATYQYQFEHAIPGQEADGAVHSADLPYVFGYYPKSGNISGNFGEIDYKLADLIQSYWVNFAKTGNPNDGTLANWPGFDQSQTFIEFAQDGRVVANSKGLRRPQCDLFREVLKRRMNMQMKKAAQLERPFLETLLVWFSE
jgi:para-nitrobenzyl esterase